MTLQISDVARYEQWHEEMVQAENGVWVSYEDHLAALSATREQAVRECAEIAREGLICTSCGHVGPWKECCDNINIDGATHDQIADAILDLTPTPPLIDRGSK